MSSAAVENRIDRALGGSSPGLWPFIAAGYPSAGFTRSLLLRLASLPIRGIELGFPYSDPIADGPVIQHAFTRSLEAGTRVADVFRLVTDLRGAGMDLPILAMVSASIVYRVGVETFVRNAATSGFDGLIVPDLSLEEAPQWSALARDAALRLSMLVAPTTSPDRQRAIARAASGFLYYVSVQGVTGARAALPGDLKAHVAEVRLSTGLPVLVGFGVSSASQVGEVCGFADGAIVGSAIVKRITRCIEGGLSEADAVEDVARFVSELCGES